MVLDVGVRQEQPAADRCRAGTSTDAAALLCGYGGGAGSPTHASAAPVCPVERGALCARVPYLGAVLPAMTSEQRLVEALIVATNSGEIAWREGMSWREGMFGDSFFANYNRRQITAWWYQDEGPTVEFDSARVRGMGVGKLIEAIRLKLHPSTREMRRAERARQSAAMAQQKREQRKVNAACEAFAAELRGKRGARRRTPASR